MLKTALFSFLAILALFFLYSCSEKQSPESILADYADSIEEAAESGNARKIRSLISQNYRDEKQRTAKEISTVVSGYLLHNKSIHILKKITEVKQLSDRSISATILAAVSGTPLSDVSFLSRSNADIYWFEIVIVDEDETWRLASSSWRQALVSDFLPD